MPDLPPLGSVKDCPKCGTHYTYGPPKAEEAYQSNEPRMEWHEPAAGKSGIVPSSLKLDCCAEAMKSNDNSWSMEEHISRECLICRYRWVEACFVPEQP